MTGSAAARDFAIHGGRLAQACARWGGTPADWLDLSTGINPAPWPVEQAGPIDWHALPDPAALAALEAVAARHFGVDPAHCCAVPGSELAMRQLAALLALPGAHVPPCYGGHTSAFAPSLAIAAPGELPDAPHATIFANPPTPYFRTRSHDELRAWLAAAARPGGWLLVDEAFADATPALSVAPWVADDARLVVLRSFGKFFGLAGARLGFVLGPRALLADLRARMGDWPINAGAMALGAAAYADADWIAATRRALPKRAAALDALLARHGLAATGASPLFRLVATPRAAALFGTLAERRILTRPFAWREDWLRLGVPASAAALARLGAALGA